MNGPPLRILGLDPGSRRTGYGIIDIQGTRNIWVAHGVIETAGIEMAPRLSDIFNGVCEILRRYQPTETAVEEVFVKINIGSALVLGQARGAAICALAQAGLPVAEYAPARIKQAIVGSGRAEKKQVQHMVKALLKLERAPPEDAADGLACALCHSHLRAHNLRLMSALAKASR